MLILLEMLLVVVVEDFRSYGEVWRKGEKRCDGEGTLLN
jgi:hypothetical protein